MEYGHMGAALSRRQFVGGALATGALLALAGTGTMALADEEDAGSDEVQAIDEAGVADGVAGGTLRWFITSPSGIEPFMAEETQGVQVMYQLFDTLTTYDWATESMKPLACDSYEVNDDATQYTFHLKQDATFHNGQPVTAADYKYAWERLCDGTFLPSPSTQGYILEPIEGAPELISGQGGELNIETPDDYTLVVNLRVPFADFDATVAYPATAPIPAGSTDTEEDFLAFQTAPVGNGPFMMNGEWVDGQYIQLQRYDGYAGEQPFLDGIIFQIFTDDQTAWMEFQAGNLDYTTIPSGQFTSTLATYGEAESDGYLANPGHQVFTGDGTSIWYLVCNNDDEVMSNRDLRIAISCAINRQAICDTVMEGTRIPAANILSPGFPGYVEGAWDYCPAEGDQELAAQYFDSAGYPLDDSGSRGLSLTVSCASSSANTNILSMVQADLAACGVDLEIQTLESAAYMDAMQSGDFQIGRSGMTTLVPTPYQVLQVLFYTGTGDNYSGYSSEEFDAAIDTASAIVDTDERVAAYQEANAIVAADFPVIPLFFFTLSSVTSSRVNNLYLNPISFARLTRCWLSA